MREIVKFESIGQFRNFIKTMQYFGYNKVNLIGTVKIHGTNSSVGLDLKDNSLFCQSRNRVLSLDDDNYDFVKYVEDNKSEFLKIFDEIKNKINTENYDSIIIYGELAGKGIQSKVAVSEIERFFAPFSVRGVNKDTVDILDVKLEINESIRFYILQKDRLLSIFSDKEYNSSLFSMDDLNDIGSVNNYSVISTKSTSEFLHRSLLLISEYVIDIVIFGNDLKSFSVVKNRAAFTMENAIELLDLIEVNKYAAIY